MLKPNPFHYGDALPDAPKFIRTTETYSVWCSSYGLCLKDKWMFLNFEKMV